MQLMRIFCTSIFKRISESTVAQKPILKYIHSGMERIILVAILTLFIEYCFREKIYVPQERIEFPPFREKEIYE